MKDDKNQQQNAPAPPASYRDGATNTPREIHGGGPADVTPDAPAPTVGERVVQAAMSYHRALVRDGGPADEMAVIDRMIRTDIGIGWTWEKEYVRNGQFQWCGTFAAVCWRTVGLHPALAKSYYSSTVRLNAYAHYRAWSSFKFTGLSLLDGRRGEIRAMHQRHGGERELFEPLWKAQTVSDLAELGYVPRAGDIGILGHAKEHALGRHVVLVRGPVDPASRTIPTVEGNGRGTLGNGKAGEGVVVNERPVSEFRSFIRPAPLDLVPTIEFWR